MALLCALPRAGVAELVDAADSKSAGGNTLGVQVPLPVPINWDPMLPPMKYCSSCGETLNREIPGDDNRERWVCNHCDTIHYQNPIIVVGCVAEKDGKILLCKRAIEPRHGFWTVPAGFMELGESLAEGAARETLEEACADIEIGHLFASVDVISAGQVHLFFSGTLAGGYGVGEESLETRLFGEDEIPWDDLAFPSGRFALQKYFEDQGRNNGVHTHVWKK